LDSLSLTSEPPVYSQLSSSLNCLTESHSPGKTQSIVELSLTLGDRLASLIGHNLCNIISVLSNESIPLQHPLSSSTRVDLAVGLKGCMSCLDSLLYIFGSIVWCCGPCSTSTGICPQVSASTILGRGYHPGSWDTIPTTSKRFFDCASSHSPLIRELSRNISLLFNYPIY